jgi:enoyl-CoA hydratase/carnithine racemase
MNAVNQDVQNGLNQAFSRFNNDDGAWVAIVTGRGDKAFSVGVDLKDKSSQEGATKGKAPLWYSMDIWKPMIGAINGYCIALGWMIAQKCDIRIASEHAQMGISEARFNLAASFVCDLVDQIGLAHALEVSMWGDKLISAQRGFEIGWINRVVPQDQLMKEALSWAERMECLAPRTVRNLKQIIYRSLQISRQDRSAFAVALQQNLAGMEDTIEGAKAFREKRKPQFQNR